MNPSCTTHLMLRFAEKNKILYVNPIGSDIFGGVNGNKRFGTRIIRKLRSFIKYLRKPRKNLYVFSPLFIPIQGGKTVDIINNFLLKLQIQIVCWLADISKPMLWLENIRAADIMNCFGPGVKVYHVSDLFTDDLYTSNHHLNHQREKRVSDESNLLICVSKELHLRKQSQRGNVFYIQHGVDFELFRKAAQKVERIKELADIPRPIAGYFGTMTAHNDIELLLWCARNLSDVSFVFAGQITGGDYSELDKLDNVYFLGQLSYEKIPWLCACFDVCMLQWKMNEWIRCCNPLKMFEYMASGKPIVSVPIGEAIQYSDVVSIAHNKEEFAQKIQWELQNDTSERVRKRIEIAREHSWDKHVERISELILNEIEIKKSERFYNADPRVGNIV